jgi:hypothetical protein
MDRPEDDGVLRIERPLATYDNLDLQYETCQFVYEKLKREWDYLPMSRLWSVGYGRSLLVDWFASFPPELVYAFRKILAIFQQNMIARLKYLSYFESMRRTTVDCGSRPAEFDGIWDDAPSFAFLSLRFNPNNQTRQKVWANKMQADINCVHREELLARFANHDLPFGMSDIEFLCLAVDELLNSTVDRGERYIRQIAVCNGEVRAVLLHGSRTRSYNSVGQLVQVLRRPITRSLGG